MKKYFKRLILFLVMSVTLLAAKNDYFVTAQWLKENITNDNLLILDARGSKVAYMKGHIPGAVLTSWTEFAKMDGTPTTNKEWGVLKDKVELENSLHKVGLNTDSEVIVYTDPLNGFGEGARILWILKYAGFKDVRLLDGGIEAWTKLKGKTTIFGKTPTKGDFTIKEFNDNFIISTNTLAKHLNDFSVLDTREVEEYNGLKNYGESKNGRIPGAKNIFYKEFLDKNGLLKPEGQIEALIAKSGLDTSKPIVTYCTGGVRSSMGWLIMVAYGYEALNYDSSFAGWTFADMPLED